MPTAAQATPTLLYPNAQIRFQRMTLPACARQLDAPGNPAQVVAEQANRSRISRNIRATAQGDADVTRRKCRRVVDAVPDHAHRPDALLDLFDGSDLLRRQECASTFTPSCARWLVRGPRGHRSRSQHRVLAGEIGKDGFGRGTPLFLEDKKPAGPIAPPDQGQGQAA